MTHKNRYKKWTHNNWSGSFQEMWNAGIRMGSPFAPGGRAASLNQRTVWNAETALGRLIEFWNSAPDGGLLALPEHYLAPHVLEPYARQLSKDLAPYTVWSLIGQARDAVRYMRPQSDLSEVNQILVRLQTVAKPAREVQSRLVPPEKLISLGEQMMAEAEAEALNIGGIDRNTAKKFRTGAMLVVGALCPLRLRNWQMAILDQHVTLEVNGTGRMQFAADEMKGKFALEFELPDDCARVLLKYVERFRPHLMDPDAKDLGYLWPNSEGDMCHRNSLPRLVRIAVFKHTGKKFAFHFFRHAAAQRIVELAPERACLAKGVLNHRSFKTTKKYYIRGQMREAVRRYGGAVKDIVKRAKRRRLKRKS